jgi:hypothetical protein
MSQDKGQKFEKKLENEVSFLFYSTTTKTKTVNTKKLEQRREPLMTS